MSGGLAVVIDTGSEAADRFPAASFALTVKVYAVDGASPVMVTPAVVELTTVGPPETWYATTPTLSVDAAQVRATEVIVGTPATGVPGVDGGVTSDETVVKDQAYGLLRVPDESLTLMVMVYRVRFASTERGMNVTVFDGASYW